MWDGHFMKASLRRSLTRFYHGCRRDDGDGRLWNAYCPYGEVCSSYYSSHVLDFLAVEFYFLIPMSFLVLSTHLLGKGRGLMWMKPWCGIHLNDEVLGIHRRDSLCGLIAGRSVRCDTSKSGQSLAKTGDMIASIQMLFGPFALFSYRGFNRPSVIHRSLEDWTD